jgi:3-deoxy-manno-octulosonate cytidylyltransferase (CMP-KDO synthetase)
MGSRKTRIHFGKIRVRKTIAIIPARLESTRLPKKLLLDLCGKPLIQRVVENTLQMRLFDAVYVATDSKIIADVCASFACPVIETGPHSSGTARLAEAITKIKPGKIIVNVQGDEPFLQKKQLQTLIQNLEKNKTAHIATLVTPSSNFEESQNPNIVKAVRDHHNKALYFSRHAIPYPRDPAQKPEYLHHVGVYAYRYSFLKKYPSLKPCSLESIEQLEQLRFLTNGYSILLVETQQKTIGIDTLEDLENARKFYAGTPKNS